MTICSFVSGQTAGNKSQTLHFHNQCNIWWELSKMDFWIIHR